MAWQSDVEALRREKDEAFRHDPDSPIPRYEREAFRGLSYFPIDPRYRFELDLVRDAPKPLDIQRSGGDVVRYTRLGHFEIPLPAGHATLALYESDGHSFVPFRDATSGKQTYGAGRYIDPPETEPWRYVVDFNQAYNPLCAYNEAYSCPFPPPENWLQVPVEAGEKAPAGH